MVASNNFSLYVKAALTPSFICMQFSLPLQNLQTHGCCVFGLSALATDYSYAGQERGKHQALILDITRARVYDNSDPQKHEGMHGRQVVCPVPLPVYCARCMEEVLPRYLAGEQTELCEARVFFFMAQPACSHQAP
ncbi:hypothetical protein BaRGS_00036684 [Batillaria attramentaria]|uniref:Uncharacterized protein n=1 Tax=Batillaria attramentaria TaxID=370345 RepID=A0ABD0JBJ0_9CAEN